jgi:hypothetical protein
MEQWDRNYYITTLAGANNGSSLVIMSKGNISFSASCMAAEQVDYMTCCQVRGGVGLDQPRSDYETSSF